MKITLLLLVVLLSGCGLTYEETKTREGWCTSRGLTTVWKTNLQGYVSDVYCTDVKGRKYRVLESSHD